MCVVVLVVMVVFGSCLCLPAFTCTQYWRFSDFKHTERESDREIEKEREIKKGGKRERITCLHTQITERSRGGERNNYMCACRQRRDMRERESCRTGK